MKKLPSVETFVPLFGWVSAGPTEAHSYLWPKVKKSLPRRTGLKILDLRSGNGYLASKPSELGHVVIGVVASPDGVEIARKSYPNVRFELRSVYDDLADLGSDFDVVLSSEVIEHLYDPKALIIKAYAALRRGGVLLLTTPYHGYIKNLGLSLLNVWDGHHHPLRVGGHIKFFSKRTIRDLITQCGFQNVRIVGAGRLPLLWKSMVVTGEKNG